MARRTVAVALTLLILAGGVAYIAYAWDYWLASSTFGTDFRLYTEATARWMAGGPWYHPYQLAGPYTFWGQDPSPILYPPTLLVLLVPATILPAFLWWAVPIAITAWAVWRLRPRPLVWPFLAFLVAFPMTSWFVVTGNPVMWFTAALAAGCAGGPWAVTILLKPTLGPFALFGIWRRQWWIGLAILALVSLAFLPLWADYVTVVRNTSAPPWYSINQFPMMMIPLLAWLGRTPNERAEGSRRGPVDPRRPIFGIVPSTPT